MRRICTLLAVGACSCSLLLDELEFRSEQDSSADSAVDAFDAGEDADELEPDADRRVDADADQTHQDSDVAADANEDTDADTDESPDETACDDLLSEAFLCDSFEGSLLDHWDSTSASVGEVALQDVVVYRGGSALRAESFAFGGVAELWFEGPATITSGDIYARLYLQLPASDALHALTFLWVGEAVSPWQHIGVQALPHGRLAVWIEEPGLWEQSDEAVLPLDRWTCIQMRVGISETSGSLELWIDEAPAIAIADSDTLPIHGYSGFGLGVPNVDEHQGPYAFYIDEVSIGTTPLPCDP